MVIGEQPIDQVLGAGAGLVGDEAEGLLLTVLKELQCAEKQTACQDLNRWRYVLNDVEHVSQ